MDIYVVGGSVRDLLLGRPGADRDFLVLGAAPDEFLRAFPGARMVGKAFPVALYRGSEYAFAAGDIWSDLARRDLTVNALALDSTGMVYALPTTFDDLAKGILRPISTNSLADDPVRVFRAARFFADLPGFSAHADLIEAMRSTAAQNLLGTVAAERVAGETLKALGTPMPSRFLALLRDCDCLSPWFAELDRSRNIPAGPPKYHDKDVLGHIMDVMDRLAGSPLLVWMGLCHDLGKASTDPDKWPRHHGHDTRGAALARKIGERLALPGKYIEAGVTAARLHMVAARYPTLRTGTKVDLLDVLHRRGLTRELFTVVRADHGADHLDLVLRDLGRMLTARLPEQDRNKGPESGRKLRLLRCDALRRPDNL